MVLMEPMESMEPMEQMDRQEQLVQLDLVLYLEDLGILVHHINLI